MHTLPLTLKRLSGTKEEIEAIQGILEKAPKYSLNVNGRLPLPNEAQNDFDDLPPTAKRENKYVWGVFEREELIGVVDVLRQFPNVETCVLGLLLLREDFQSKGLGTKVYQATEQMIRLWPETKKIRLGVVRTNAVALPFWHKQGFVENGEVKPWNQDDLKTEVIILTKDLL